MTVIAAITGDREPGDVFSNVAADFLSIAAAPKRLRKPELWVLHPADYADFVGVRRTRSGRWVWRGKAYRRRDLALRRAPRVTEVKDASVTVMLDPDGVAKHGQMLVMQRDIMRDQYFSPAHTFDAESVFAWGMGGSW